MTRTLYIEEHDGHFLKWKVRIGIRKCFYCAVAQYLINRIPFENKLQKFLSRLNPVRRFDHISVSDVEILARQLHYDEAMITQLVDEWKVYQVGDCLAAEYEKNTILLEIHLLHENGWWQDKIKMSPWRWENCTDSSTWECWCGKNCYRRHHQLVEEQYVQYQNS